MNSLLLASWRKFNICLCCCQEKNVIDTVVLMLIPILARMPQR